MSSFQFTESYECANTKYSKKPRMRQRPATTLRCRHLEETEWDSHKWDWAVKLELELEVRFQSETELETNF